MASETLVRRLVLVHKDPVLADRVRAVLTSSVKRLYRVAHFTHLIDALTYLKVTPADVVLVGPRPVETSQDKAIQKISAAFPDIPVVALLSEMTSGGVRTAQAAGARECLWADDVNQELWSRTFEFCYREMAISRELATVSARLDWLVHTDSLTGMLNRKGMERAVMAELARCRQNETELVVVLVDLDDFSRINATMGHGVGDLVLVAAARRITESVREHDKVARCGTDRFVVMLPDTTAAEGQVVAEKIRLAIGRDVIQAGESVLTTTASLGVASISSNSLSFDEVLSKAHFVLQRGKLAGKNRVANASDSTDPDLEPTADPGPDTVRALLRGNVLEVARQPIVNLEDGRIVSHEMLIRGPEGPLRRPDNLFRFCQERDILPAVDLRCLKKCAEAALRYADGARFHVNIMPATLLQTPAEELIRVLRFQGQGGQCCLEISEQQLLGDPSVLVPRVRVLQEAGIRIAIDDVGFGNSCLEGLIMLQPQVMKIDKRLIGGLAQSKDLRGALTRLLKVADVLGAEVVAEGIAVQDDYQVLLDLGVRFGQGYLFGKPKLCTGEAAVRAEIRPIDRTVEPTGPTDSPGADHRPAARLSPPDQPPEPGPDLRP